MNSRTDLEQRVLHLEKLLYHTNKVLEELVTEQDGRYLTTYSNSMDVTGPVKPALERVAQYFAEKRQSRRPEPPRLQLVKSA